MNNKGFTLIELLLTIAILGLIITIAVPAYNTVSKGIRESQRKNIVKEIEIAASKYAYDTGETIIFADKLVTEGYIESDDEDGNIIDPVNHQRMNCYIVEMSKSSDYYNAKFIDGKNYDDDGICDLNKLQENSENVNIQVLNESNFVSDTSNWITGNISLRAFSNTLIIDCINNKCVWSSSSGASFTGVDEINLNNISGLLETKYTFQYTVYDTDNSEVKRYKSSVDLKIDNESPTIYQNEITVSDKFIFSDYKNIVISASDGKGSGIEGYYLGLYINQLCNSSSISDQFSSSNKFKITENGTYLICVKDKVGNISSYGELKINYIN